MRMPVSFQYRIFQVSKGLVELQLENNRLSEEYEAENFELKNKVNSRCLEIIFMHILFGWKLVEIGRSEGPSSRIVSCSVTFIFRCVLSWFAYSIPNSSLARYTRSQVSDDTPIGKAFFFSVSNHKLL